MNHTVAKRFLMLIAVGLASHAAVLGQEDQTPRGMIVKEGLTDAKDFSYGNKWAVIVGINYDKRPAELGSVGKLKNAEDDAKAVFDMLTANYGYAAENIVLLRGPEATHSAIVDKLDAKFLCDKDKVKPGDSVLFYFAGHGYSTQYEKDGSASAFIFPFDVTVAENGTPLKARVIDVHAVVRDLSRNCPARHKLFILDSCYAASIFSENYGHKSTGNEHVQRQTRRLFDDPAFQAITSCRASETSSDGKEQHSPFTLALLRAMSTQGKRGGLQPCTANQLFRSIQFFFDNQKLPAEQVPVCRWLDYHQGEFHFFPSPSGKFTDYVEENPEQARKMLLAMVPSTFGNWWVDEAPWFMPGIRYTILDGKPESRSQEDEVNLDVLKKIALEVKSRVGPETSPEIKSRLECMALLLNAPTQSEMKTAMADITRRLEEKESLDVTDQHFLAVLQHKLDQMDKARDTFKAALARYEELQEKQPEIRPLQALCYVDYGYHLLQRKSKTKTSLIDVSQQYRDAAQHFHKARQQYDAIAPAAFRVFALYQEATAWRSAGNYGLAEDRMQEAMRTLKIYDPADARRLSASFWKNLAWHYMILWQFRDAGEAFEQSHTILSKFNVRERPETRIDLFHVQHGLAMIDRYQGNALEALKKYRKLTPAIVQAIRDLDESTEARDNYAQIRALLYNRLVNTLERQGDCNFYSDRPDFLEAADDYRRATQACRYISADQHDAIKAQLFYKRALAVCLDARANDFDLAAQLCKAADELKKNKSSPRLEFYAALAHYFAERREADACAVETLQELRNAIKEHRANFEEVAEREDLETMMFSCKLLLSRELPLCRTRPSEIRFQVEEDADMLLELCRRAHQTKAPDPATLKYLRPYYDMIFAARVAVEPKHCKELIEVAWEATRGTAYNKPEKIVPLLVLYHHQDSGTTYLLLDAPHACSECFALGKDCTLDQLRQADEKNGFLVLPDALRKSASKMPQLLVRWHDPVHRLGYRLESVVSTVATSSASALAEQESLLEPLADAQFPFELKHVLPKEKIIADERVRFMRTRNPTTSALRPPVPATIAGDIRP